VWQIAEPGSAASSESYRRQTRRGRSDARVFRHVLQFGIVSLIPMALLAALLTWNLENQATAQAIEEAKHDTREVVRAVVAPDLPEGIVRGDSAAIAAMDRIVHQRVLNERVVRIKIWSATGRILYSDESRLIGKTFPLDDSDRNTLSTGAETADLSDLTRPENQYEADYGQLLEVYLRVRAPVSGEPLMFEDYIKYADVTERSRGLLLSVLPSLLGGLVLLELALLPVAWHLARRVRDGQRERLRLLQHAVDASEAERRRIAGDLHDSTVQDLAAVSYSLAGTGRQLASAGQDAAAAAVHEAARVTRGSVRQLRTLLTDIYPPILREEGLRVALQDLMAVAGAQGLRTELALPPKLALGEETERLVYRVAQEAVRNVVAHARAGRVEVRLQLLRSLAVLTVHDNGRGFTPERDGSQEPNGHFGLRVLHDLAREAGGELQVVSGEGRGTTVRLQVPAV
jgi:two-component system, NarL family, sensor kinase